MNLGTGGDPVENLVWQAISLPLPLSVQNIVVQCGTNHILTDSPRHIADSMVAVGTTFRRKSNNVNIIMCSLTIFICKNLCFNEKIH